ncbi:MAG: peptidylprolyl isomerase [Nanoarchaeota archaeon]
MNIEKGDFIEIDFTGKVKDGEVFDSTLKEELKKIHHGHDHSIKPKPFVFCLGQNMFLKSLEEFLIGKEIEKKYEIELEPENAFGKRMPSLIQKIPIKIFKEQKINPIPGVTLNFDGKVGKILTVSGGRVMVDFNSPLAGKIVVYNIKILRKITDLNEKIKALNDFFFGKDFKFEIKDKTLIFKVEKALTKFVELFKDKFKEILNLDIEIKEIKETEQEDKKTQ